MFDFDTFDEFVEEATISGTFVDMYDPTKEEWTDKELFEVYPAKFEQMFKFDVRNTEAAFPVFIYEKDGKPVAYWDCENVNGKIAKGMITAS
jgi:hypothetical protein